MSNTTTAPTEWGLPSENLEVVESIDKIKETSQQFLQVGDEYLIAMENLKKELKKDFFKMFIGSIHQFTGIAGEGFLRCDGSVYKKADYPDLYAVIKDSYQSHYKKKNDKDVLPADSFVVPNLEGKYLTQNGSDTTSDGIGGKLGDILPDTMRHLIGGTEYIAFHSTGLIDRNGVFNGGSGSTKVIGFDSGKYTSQCLSFDSRFGVAGQEGKASPNIGNITRPATVNIYFYILAKI